MGLVWVKEGTVKIVERNGQYNRTLEPGLSCISPILEEIRYQCWKYSMGGQNKEISGQDIPTRVIVLDTPPMEFLTQDESTVVVDTNMHIQIINIQKFVYDYQDEVIEVILKSVETTVRRECRKHHINKLIEQPEIIEQSVIQSLQTNLDDEESVESLMGFETKLFKVESVKPSEDRIKFDKERNLAERKAMAEATAKQREMEVLCKKQELENQARMERLMQERECAMIEVETQRSQKIKAAEADAEAQILIERRRIEMLREMFGEDCLEKYLRLKELETAREFGKNTHYVSPGAAPWSMLSQSIEKK